MRIAFISIIREPWGGSEELWADCANEALQLNHNVLISAYDCGVLSTKSRILKSKGAGFDLRIGTISKALPKLQYISKRLRRAFYNTIGNPFNGVLKYKPDIILYIGTAYSIAKDYKILQVVKKLNVPLYINVQLNHEAGKYSFSKSEKEKVITAYNVAKKIFFVSKRNWNTAQKDLGIQINNGVVIRNPVNINSTSLIKFPSTDVVQMAMVANLVTVHKGQDIVMQILSSPAWKSFKWHLNIYGKGIDEEALREMVNQKGLNEKVTFHGKVNDIRMVWEQNQILLMPSHMEGMPLALVEAMLCGRVAVVTNVGGCAEWIEHGVEGFIAKEATVESFEIAMQQAFERMSEWENIGIKAHDKAIELYDPQAGKTLLHSITA